MLTIADTLEVLDAKDYTSGDIFIYNQDSTLAGSKEYVLIKEKTRYHSGGDGGISSYTITMEAAEHGTVVPDANKVHAGKTVTLTVTPDENYTLKALNVSDAKGNAVSLTKENDITYTFVMPASNVIVSTSFTENKSEEGVDSEDSSYVKSGYHKCPQDETCVYAKYVDANTKAWYHDGVHFCVEKGYMIGISEDKFTPNASLSRAMLVTILWRMENSPAVDYAMSFTDVKPDRWYTEAVHWAQSTGVVKGYNDTAFGPQDDITREQLAAILYRYTQYKGADVSSLADLNSFTDAASVHEWAVNGVRWANAAGILNGRPEKIIAPTDNATRAEAACMVQRFCETLIY